MNTANPTNDEIDIVESYQHLAPIANKEEQKTYIDLLTKAISNEEVKNIALTGAYGSGKSSIIKTFIDEQEEEEQEKILEISLANFKEIKEEKTPEGILKKEQLIEKSILQQILYKVNQEEVPYSRFARIHNFTSKQIKSFTVLLSVWVIALYFYLSNDKFIELFQYDWVQSVAKIFPVWVSEYFILHFILISTSIPLLFILVKYISRIKLNSFSLKGADLKIDAIKGSLLNEHIEEILYFFEVTPYEIVFIEDLDRHKSSGIFQKLRELNNIINGYKSIKKNKKVTFVYAVKDSLFTGEERTKFFEWIIPVVPVINTTTAKHKLIERIEKIEKDSGIDLLSELSPSLLKEVSYYITDLRQLNNMFNEYLLYRKLLTEVDSQNKLFSIITYKNLFPLDFANLHKSEGNIYKIFDEEIEKIRKSIIERLSKDKKEKESELKEIETEVISNEKELRAIFLAEFLKSYPNATYLFDSKSSETSIFSEILTDDILFKKFINGGFTHLYAQNRSAQEISYDFSGVYNERLKVIKKKSTSKEKDILELIKALNNEIQEIGITPLFALLQKYNDVKYISSPNDFVKWSPREKKNWELIISLIEKGMIDESYRLYISYFYDTEITLEDFKWIQMVQNDKEVDQFYKITNTEAVIDDLSTYDFNKKGIVNKDILKSFTLSERSDQDFLEKKKTFFSHLLTNQEENYFTFIQKVIDNNDDKEFISRLIFIYTTYKDDFWRYIEEYIINSKNIDKTNQLLIILFESVDKEGVLNLREIDKLKNYFDNMSDFLYFIDSIDIQKHQKVFDILEDIGVRFKQLNIYELPITDSIIKEISERAIYDLTSNMLEIVFDHFEVQIKDLTFGELSKIDDIESYLYFYKNSDKYIQQILIEAKYADLESLEGLTKLLNHNKTILSSATKRLIEIVGVKVKDITTIDNKEFWDMLFLHSKVEPSWENVTVYYNEKNELNNALIQYLNNVQNVKILSKTKIDSAYTKEHPEFKTSVIKNIAESNEIDNKLYRMLMGKSGYWFNLDMSNLSEDKIDILIDKNIIKPTIQNIENLQENFSQKHIALIEKRIYNFRELFEDLKEVLSRDDYISLFNSSTIHNSRKKEILETLDLEAFDINEALALAIFSIFNATKEEISFELLKDLISKVSIDNRISNLLSQTSNLVNYDCNMIHNMFEAIGSPYNKLCKVGSYISLEKNQSNIDLIHILKDKDCISSYSLQKDDIRVNRFRKTR